MCTLTQYSGLKQRMSVESEKSRTPDTTCPLSAPLDDPVHSEAQVSVCVATCLYKLYFHFMCALEMGLYYGPLGAHWFPLSDPSGPMGAQRL